MVCFVNWKGNLVLLGVVVAVVVDDDGDQIVKYDGGGSVQLVDGVTTLVCPD